MGNYTLLQKRPTGYYYRQLVPQDLQQIVGKREIVQSLKTKEKVDALRIHKELAAHYSHYFDGLRNGQPAPMPIIPSAADTIMTRATTMTESNATDSGRGKTLEWLAEEWIRQKAPTERQFKKAGLARRAIQRFQEQHGAIRIGGLEGKHLIEFKNTLYNDTANNHSGRTKNSYIDQIKILMSFAHGELLIKHNPFKGLKALISEDDSEHYRPYDKAELEALLFNPEYHALRQTKPSYFWLPLVALFTGTRIEEAAQLYVTDIKEKNCIRYIDINDDAPDKKLKNKGSRRIIPIHNTLLRMGFCDYIASLDKGKKHVFHDLKPYKGRRSHYYGKWYSAYKDKVDAELKSLKVFHSYRGSFKDMCREADIPKDVHDRFTGHNNPNDVGEDAYGSGQSIGKLNRYLQQIVPLINLSTFYISPTFLNPAPHITTPPTPATPAPEQRKPLNAFKCISLAETYNRIGKVWFQDTWKDYNYCLKHNGKQYIYVCKETDFSNAHRGKPEAKPITVGKIDISVLPIASDNEVEIHSQITNYLSKVLGSPRVRKLASLKNKSPEEMPDGFFKLVTCPKNYALESIVTDKTDTYNVLVDSDSLEQLIKEDL